MLITALMAIALQNVIVDTGFWTFKARPKDPITDLQSAVASVHSTISDARLTVQCDVVGDPVVSVLFIPDKFTGESGSQRVIFRADGASPIEFISDPISKAKAITDIKAVRQLAHIFAGASVIYVRAFDYNGQPVDGRFEVKGGETAIRDVFAACAVPYDAPSKKKKM